jgi:hypothetical protein
VTGDGQARICERLGAKFPGPTRQEETDLRQTGLRRPGENLTIRHREANVTAPLLDSTQPPKEFPIADVPGMAKATFFGLLVGYLVLEKSSDCGALIEAQDDGLFLACRSS